MSTSIDKVLTAMGRMNASDMFVTTGKPPALRVKGEVRRLDMPPTPWEEMEAFLTRLLTPEQQARYAETGDLDVGYSPPEGGRYRLNLHRQQGQLGIVARALPMGTLTFDGLKLPATLERLADQHRGLVLVTGATGSGKSTTLAAMIHRINTTRNAHIVTIEDPIEFVHADLKSRITQREIGSDTSSFGAALRHVVRESPDVILIGEMRDAESMQVAISAALTGHLVFSTLHTLDAVQSIQRIMGYFPEEMRTQVALDLSLCLQGIVCQRLLPAKQERLRVPAVEILVNSPAVSRLIREQRPEELADLMRSAKDSELQVFDQAVVDLFKADVISFETGEAYASNPDTFRLAVQGMDIGVDAFRRHAGGRSGGLLDMKSLLGIAIQHGASDLHLSAGRPPIFRVGGELHRLGQPPLSGADVRTLLFSILNNRQRSHFELEKELDFSIAVEDMRFRVNAYYQKGQIAVAMRTIASVIPTPVELGLPDAVLGMAERPHGLLLVVGPTGSGKSTTLACLIDRINRGRRCHIITVEDPIEYSHTSQLASVDQREVHDDTHSFSSALKYVLRQDPDVILVGEMRDLETISAALTAAETGHLVLATLHTNDAAQTIDRIVDVFPPHQQTQIRAQLAACLLGVISQRLLPRADGQGRVAAFEVMLGTPAIRNVVREGKTHQIASIMQTQAREGMITMDKALLSLYQRRLITYDEASRFVLNPQVLGPTPP